MELLVIFSLVIKSFGAVLEILSQSLISRGFSVETYGTYSFFVSLADGFYTIFFAGIIKLNNFYIPQGNGLKAFKKKYYRRYVFPVTATGIIISLLIKNPLLVGACLTAAIYARAMDTSSQLMSYGHYKTALMGEYFVGRVFVLLSIGTLLAVKIEVNTTFYYVYAIQYIAAISYYYLVSKKAKKPEEIVTKKEYSTKQIVTKYGTFQVAAIAQTIVMQSSVIVQYIFGGAYQTALVSIVLTVRKLINFISGPTSKLYQPEFAKKFSAGDQQGLGRVYAQITRIQLCFMMPVFTLLIGSPEIILTIFSKELIRYGNMVRIVALVFLFMIAFGPLSNFLSMVGQEKSDARSDWISIFIMYGVMFALRSNQYFVIVGFCAQTIFTTVYKLAVFVRYLHTSPMPYKDYFKLALITLACLFVLRLVSGVFVAVIIICAVQFMLNFVLVFPREELKDLKEKLAKKIKKR